MGCGYLYYRIAARHLLAKRANSILALAAFTVAALAGILALVVLTSIIAVAGAEGPVQYWAESPGIVMFCIRVLVFGFLIMVAPLLVLACLFYIAAAAKRKDLHTVMVLLVPLLLFFITIVAMMFNLDFAPMV